ncbi:hypothetical protein UY3_18215 [Chelonia mydas]|uniref:Uncharacterized protein n=1 Tax=Chelonia mydas TaxID=8469 RepID=M7AIB9_CHEMY|nr:hypothetical protein UY3_18215 [Chelonia mydas]
METSVRGDKQAAKVGITGGTEGPWHHAMQCDAVVNLHCHDSATQCDVMDLQCPANATLCNAKVYPQLRICVSAVPISVPYESRGGDFHKDR